MNKLFLCLLLSIGLAGCDENEQHDDIVQQPDKEGSIETILSVTHAGGVDILTTVHKIWVKGSLVRTLEKTDTLNALGMITEEVEDKDGNTQTKRVPKDYEFFITVK